MMVVGRHLEYFSHIINYIPKKITGIRKLPRTKQTNFFLVSIPSLVIMCDCIFFIEMHVCIT